MDINSLLRYSVEKLQNIAYTNPFVESRYILKELLNVDDSYLIVNGSRELEESIVEEFKSIIKRRVEGEPLQYILGKTYFYGNEFFVSRDVLIPRSDTEISVETIISTLSENNLNSMVEIGVGSGAVIISVGKAIDIYIEGVDISDSALELTKRNMEKHSVNYRVYKSNLFENVEGTFDLIYSNPPYIPRNELDKLQLEVREFEPILALDGGEDGLNFYREIVKKAEEHLNPNGYLIFEIGFDQGERVKKLLEENNYTEIEIIVDLENRDRVVKGKLCTKN